MIIPFAIITMICAGGAIKSEIDRTSVDVVSYNQCMRAGRDSGRSTWEYRSRCHRTYGNPDAYESQRNGWIAGFFASLATGGVLWLFTGLLGWIWRGFAEKKD